jgi:type II secretory pathway component PulM
MSVRVNLLPEATRQRDRTARQRLGLAGVGALLVLGLGLAYWMQVNRVDAAVLARDEAQDRVQELQAQQDELQAFAELEQRVDEANNALVVAMGNEISYAGVLQDVAAVTPTETALTDLEVTVVDLAGPDGERTRRSIARVVASGESLLGHAPGVERILLELNKVGAFFDVFFTSSAADPDEPEVSLFTVEIDLGEEAYTNRYRDGVPEELR